MKKSAEENVADFYNSTGWETQAGITQDARDFEDLRKSAREYVSKCRLRVLKFIPDSGGNMLDMASGPIQYEEYLSFSRNFDKRYCVDLSQMALDGAREKIGSHGVYLHGSFFDIDLEQDSFDCSISLHTIYHMEKDRQEEAVRKLLYVTKPGKPVIIVYSNPRTLFRTLTFPLRMLKNLRNAFRKNKKNKNEEALYFHPHPLNWWNRFSDVADVKIVPWRSFSSEQQKLLIPDNRFGRWIFDILFRLEDRFPRFFVRNFAYPMIVLRKKKPRILPQNSSFNTTDP